jgi:hypothetical protein
VFGRFDFEEARTLFDFASASNRFALILRNSLSILDFDSALMSSFEFSMRGSIFSFLRSSSDDSIPLIRLLNPHLCDFVDDRYSFAAWQEFARLSFEYLIDLSLDQLHALEALPTDLLSCNSISEMIPLIFQMYTIECSLYKTVNHFLRCFPINIVGKFMRELNGILCYIYFLQSSLEHCSHNHPLLANLVVYRGINRGGGRLVSLYESMIDEVIVWRGFTSTSKDRDYVIEHFLSDDDSILFEITLHPGSVAVCIEDYSHYQSESEVLIAAETAFKIEGVEYIDLTIEESECQNSVTIPLVKLSSSLSWSDFDINERPETVIVESDTTSARLKSEEEIPIE